MPTEATRFNLPNIKYVPITLILSGRSVIENRLKDQPDNAFHVLFDKLALPELKDLPETCLKRFEVLLTFFKYSINHPEFMKITGEEIKSKNENIEEERIRNLLCLTALGASVCYPKYLYEEYLKSYNRQFKVLMSRETKDNPTFDDLIEIIGTGKINLLPFGRGNEFDLTPERFWSIVPFYYEANINNTSLTFEKRHRNLDELLDLGYLILDGIRNPTEQRKFKLDLINLKTRIRIFKLTNQLR